MTGGLVIEGYGMTETSPVALGNPLTDARRPGTLGLPFPGTEMRVVDAGDPPRDVPAGERGELLLRGPQVFAGYWGRPEETAEQLARGRLAAHRRHRDRRRDGGLVLVDRIKEIVISGGFKVYPSQVEDHLRGMPGVADVAVVGVPGGDLGETVVAAVVLEPGAQRRPRRRARLVRDAARPLRAAAPARRPARAPALPGRQGAAPRRAAVGARAVAHPEVADVGLRLVGDQRYSSGAS